MPARILWRELAGFFKRWFGWLFGKKSETRAIEAPAFNVPAPKTLVARIGTVAETDERKMIRLAEESMRRGFPEQAAIAYRKAAKRFADEGKHLKRIAVLQQLAKVNRKDPSPHLELVDVFEMIDRKRDADLSRLDAAAIFRDNDQEAEARKLEQQVAPRSLGRAVSMARTHAPPPADDDNEYEMPGDAVMANAKAPIAKIDVKLPPVMPVALEDPTPDAPEPVPRYEQQPLTPAQIDASGAIELSLGHVAPRDSLDDLDVLDDEEGFDSIAEPPRPIAPVDDLELDALDDEEGFDSIAEPPRPAIDDFETDGDGRPATPALQGYPLGIQDAATDSDGDLGAQTMAFDSSELVAEMSAPTRSYGAIEAIQAAGGRTLAINPLPGLSSDDDEEDFDPDMGAQTIAMTSVHPDMLPDLGAHTLAMSSVTAEDRPQDIGAQTIAMTSVHAHDEDEEEDDFVPDVGAQTIAMSAIRASDHATAEVGAQTIAFSSLSDLEEGEDEDADAATTFGALAEGPPPSHTRPLPSRARFNILDAATQMDPTGIPRSVLGTNHEARARATSRVASPRESSEDSAPDPSLADALNSKIGG